MIGRGVDQIQPQHADPRLYEPHITDARAYVELAEHARGAVPRKVNPAYVWGDALAEIDALTPDARIVNLETALTVSDAAWPAKEVLYRSHPANSAVLRAARIDVCSLANNHLLDWGYAGLTETLDALDGAGIGRVGAGYDVAEAGKPAVINTANGRVIVVGIGSTTSGIPPQWAAGATRAGVALVDGWSLEAVDRVRRAVESVRQAGDALVVSVHWGANWGHELPAGQRRLARALIDKAGADVVHGHSSHHARAVELHNARPILYGCGDFITDYEGITGHERWRGDLAPGWFIGLAADGRLQSLSAAVFRSRRMRLERAPAADVAWLGTTLDRLSRPLGARVVVSAEGLEIVPA